MCLRTFFSVVLVLASTAIAQNDSKSESQPHLPAPEVVSLNAPGGMVLKATYFAAGKPGPGVILFHQSNRTRHSWDDVAMQLASAGLNILAIDDRGYGESGGKKEQRAQYQDGDLDTAFEYLVSQPGVTRAVIGAGGAGWLGVDDSVEMARRHSAEVKSLVLISGETLLPQLRFLRQASHLPGLFVVSDDDEYPPTVEAMEWLYDCSASPEKQFIHYIGPKAPWLWYETSDPTKVPPTGSHGTDLFKRHPELKETMVRWFVDTLVKTPGHAPADAVASAAVLNEIESPGGVARVTERLLEVRKRDPQAQLFPEANVDIIAEDHQREGDNRTALQIFKLNLLAYPDSADANGNLADSYLRDGQKDLARKHAQKALALLDSHAAPASSWSDTEQRRGEIRKAVEDVLKKLNGSR
jgi:pimeloyl-ACP methyl ester carboxylesterase